MDFKRALEVREHGVQRGFQQGEEDRAAGQGGLCPSLAGIMAGCEDGGGLICFNEYQKKFARTERTYKFF